MNSTTNSMRENPRKSIKNNPKKSITELKTTGTIVRVGSDKTGHWMINQ